jgi:hypothetical protein
MFERTNSQQERRSTHIRPINNFNEDGVLSNRELTETNEDMALSSRKRASSILDKINMFNKNSDHIKIVKKEEDIIPALSNQNYIKVVDEITGKAKWVNSAGNWTSRINEDEGVSKTENVDKPSHKK